MSQPLSPAAQAVMAAMKRSYDHEPTRRLIAAMLRALADQAGSAKHWHATDLRILADELEEHG